jgi:hypothetical protein
VTARPITTSFKSALQFFILITTSLIQKKIINSQKPSVTKDAMFDRNWPCAASSWSQPLASPKNSVSNKLFPGTLVLKTMATGLYLSEASPFSLSPLTNRPSSNESLQPAFDIKTMITVIIGYLSDDNFMTPPMRVNTAVREFIFM